MYRNLLGRDFLRFVCFKDDPATDPAGDPATGTGSGGGSSSADPAGDPGTGTGSHAPKEGADDNKTLTFDDFLKLGNNQAEFDRRVSKALDTAHEKWRILADDRVSEAEKLAKMTATEKAQYLAQKKEQALADREAAITKRELQATAKNTLAEKKLPLELADVLVYTDAEACNKSIAAVEKAFQKAVETAVDERLKGDKPPKKAPENNEDDLEKQVAKALAGNF